MSNVVNYNEIKLDMLGRDSHHYPQNHYDDQYNTMNKHAVDLHELNLNINNKLLESSQSSSNTTHNLVLNEIDKMMADADGQESSNSKNNNNSQNNSVNASSTNKNSENNSDSGLVKSSSTTPGTKDKNYLFDECVNDKKNILMNISSGHGSQGSQPIENPTVGAPMHQISHQPQIAGLDKRLSIPMQEQKMIVSDKLMENPQDCGDGDFKHHNQAIRNNLVNIFNDQTTSGLQTDIKTQYDIDQAKVQNLTKTQMPIHTLITQTQTSMPAVTSSQTLHNTVTQQQQHHQQTKNVYHLMKNSETENYKNILLKKFINIHEKLNKGINEISDLSDVLYIKLN